MKKEFTIRIDLESEKGIKKGLPKLLNLFKEENILASFYLVIGGESNIFEILKNRKKLKSAGERKIKVFSLIEKLRMVLFPINFSKKNKKLLKKIILEGHELGLHGYKHRKWTRNLENIDLKKEINKMFLEYKKLFKVEPRTFTSPGFNTNKNVIKELEKKGIVAISDFELKKRFGTITNIPMTLNGKNRMPFIEYWVGEGKSDNEIFKIFKNEIKNKNYVSFYLHGLFEGIHKINLLKKMIKELKKQGFKDKRIIDLI